MRAIPLTKGHEAIVDDEDFERFGHLKWFAQERLIAGRLYVMAGRNSPRIPGERRRTLLLHREIMGALPGQEVDHRDGNPLHCWRANMRLCTRVQNVINTPRRTPEGKYRGVRRNPRGGSWIAAITTSRKGIYLGSFATPELAAAAYNAAALREFGEFAVLNKLPEDWHG